MGKQPSKPIIPRGNSIKTSTLLSGSDPSYVHLFTLGESNKTPTLLGEIRQRKPQSKTMSGSDDISYVHSISIMYHHDTATLDEMSNDITMKQPSSSPPI